MSPRRHLRFRVLATALALAVSAPLALAGPAGAAEAPSATPLSSRTLDEQALYFVSYDGLVNNGSYQQSGILTHGDHQYAAWYTESRHAVLARRHLDGGEWSTVRLSHQLTVDDSHNSISLGVSAEDGRLHVAMDTHNTPVHYTRSAAGLLDGGAPWSANSFEPIGRDLAGLDIGSITYPRFVTTPDDGLQLAFRTGGSGDGTLELAEYEGGDWAHLGAWSSPEGSYEANGAVSTSRNMYLHGIGYGDDGRLHASFTWRETAAGGDILCHPGGLSNHDTGYVYSDDEGRTWHTDDGSVAAVTGTSHRVSVDTPGHVVDPLPLNYALMNQESQAVDNAGRPHVLISYRPGRFGHCSNDFVRDRRNEGYVFHVHQDSAGQWHKMEIPERLQAFGRSRLVMTEDDTAYVVMPFGRIMAATAASGWTDWTMVHDGSGIDSFGEVLVDESRVAAEGVLSILYQEAGDRPSSPIRVADFQLG
ncbi:BNR repeat-containing protein [Nocardiopsis sp. NRRL B-16309]|uniref:BNR repeat-containing protein n=1 Tax=Nocardiopsis sp. NRRL B-16309 TaxID=1519494 RepID=UPI0006AF4557|nr:BNR repeat-containing protein [Nocardiopsis sp. NRRL B-16309]KOX15639.1 Tat pathway signal sequence domain protein [Nocardiopsis sp. NRRL B-16309]